MIHVHNSKGEPRHGGKRQGAGRPKGSNRYGELTVKRLSYEQGRVKLLAENPNYPPIDITDEQDLVIWGVVTHVIHQAI